MSEYKITARIDPQTASGAAKVKQDLKGVSDAASTTERALADAFDPSVLNKSINALIARVDALDSTITGATSSYSTLQRSNESLGAALDRMAAKSVAAKAATDQGRKSTDDASNSQKGMEAAMRRVLAAVDEEAAEMMRLNALLAEAKRLHDSGKISAEQYAAAQKLVENASNKVTVQTGAQKAGMQQLGYQLGDMATMYSLGAKPGQIFASQIGQITGAIQLMSDGGSKFANFISGPWGIALSVGAILLAPLLSNLLATNSALDDAVAKLAKDAQETEINRQAQEKFNNSVAGVSAAIRDQAAALKKQEESLKTAAQRAYDFATAEKTKELAVRKGTIALLEQAKAQYAASQSQTFGAAGGAGAGMAQSIYAGRVGELEARLQKANADLVQAQANVVQTQSRLSVENGSRAADPIESIKRKYEGAGGLIELARQRAVMIAGK